MVESGEVRIVIRAGVAAVPHGWTSSRNVPSPAVTTS